MKLETLQQNLAANLISLRKKAGLKQKDLASLINYSDKSISKWERQEGIPDLYAANCLASCFGVSVDYLINSHDEQSVSADHTVQRSFNERMLILVVILSIWTLAAIVFVIFWILGKVYWLIFIAAIPVSLITLLVLNTTWNRRHHNRFIIAGLVLAIFLLIYYLLAEYHPWQLILILIPAEIVVFLSFRVGRSSKPEKTVNAGETTKI